MSQPTPLQPIVGPMATPSGYTMANMVALQRTGPRAVAKILLSVPPNIAESHLVDAVSRELLALGAVDEFLHRRAGAVLHTISEYAARMAEWGARDGDSISNRLRSPVDL